MKNHCVYLFQTACASALMFYALAPRVPAAPLARSPWPCLGANSQHTACSTAAVMPPDFDVDHNWLEAACVVTLPAAVTTEGVVVDEDGNLFVGCHTNLLSYAARKPATLSLRWNSHPNDKILAYVPAVDTAGACYAASSTAPLNGQSQAQLRKVNADGSLSWMTSNLGQYNWNLSPTILTDGTIVIGCGKSLYYMRINDAGGNPTTRFYSADQPYGKSTCVSAVSQGVGPCSNRIFAQTSWYSPATVYTSRVYAFEMNTGTAAGTVLWHHKPLNNQGRWAVQMVGTNNMLYSVDEWYARKIDGSLNGGGEIAAAWSAYVPDFVGWNDGGAYYGALSADEATLYFAAGKYLVALNTSNGTRKWSLSLGAPPTAPAVDASGHIYCTAAASLYCVRDAGTSAQVKQVLDLSAHATAFKPHLCLVDGGLYLLSADKLLWIQQRKLPAGTVVLIQ